jgi:hypothetical protein
MRHSVAVFGSGYGRSSSGGGLVLNVNGDDRIAGPGIIAGGSGGVSGGSLGISAGAVYSGGASIGVQAVAGQASAGPTFFPFSSWTAGAGNAAAGQASAGVIGTVPNYITMSDLIQYGSIENATHDRERQGLVQSLSELSAVPFVNVAGTLSGQMDYDQAHWGKIASGCKEGQVDVGFVDAADQVQAMFTSKGKAYVNAVIPTGMKVWVDLQNPESTNMVLPGDEEPAATAERLSAMAKAAAYPLVMDGSRSNFMGTSSAFRPYVAPKVSAEGVFQFEQPVLYAGVRTLFPRSGNSIVASKVLKQ